MQAATVPSFDHVFVIMMENTSYSSIVGSASAPYINSLLPSGGLGGNYYGVTHPSLPNYLSVTGASTFGITSDCTACWVNARNIVDNVEAVGKTWKTYQEGMPSACYIGDSYPYAQKHNPFIYFNDIRTNPSRCQASVVPYTQLATDLKSTATTPAYAFITPDMCHDMHDCTVQTGDTWLQQQVPTILNSPAFTTQHSLLALTWDEDDFSGTNQVALIFQGYGVGAGLKSTVTYDHYSLLRTIEAGLGLATLTTSDAGAATISDLFSAAPPPPPSPPPPPPPPASSVVGYFSWFDNATPGMSGNIHLLNTGTTPSVGTVNLGIRAVPFTLAAGNETYISFPAGTIGGPVLVAVSSGPAVLSSERVQYNSSFNEVWAMTTAQASTTSYLSWFDRASPGMASNNIHVINPGATASTVTVNLPGATPLNLNLAAGAADYVSFPVGTIGGPVQITSSQGVLASQRVAYFGTFNEVQARDASLASTRSSFNWFDKATPGMADDNIHLVNPGPNSASVTVSIPGANPITVTVAANTQQYVTFPVGTIGGPVTVSSNQPVLASQRVQYFQSFNEVPSQSGGFAASTNHLMWFDKASVGMTGDNIHVINTSTTTANVTVTLSGASPLNLSLAPNAEGYVSFPVGSIGGPVIITSSQPVLAAQRVRYYQTFNEVAAG